MWEWRACPCHVPPHTHAQIGFAELRHYLAVLHTFVHTYHTLSRTPTHMPPTHAQIGFAELRHYLIVLSKDWNVTGSFDGQW